MWTGKWAVESRLAVAFYCPDSVCSELTVALCNNIWHLRPTPINILWKRTALLDIKVHLPFFDRGNFLSGLLQESLWKALEITSPTFVSDRNLGLFVAQPTLTENNLRLEYSNRKLASPTGSRGRGVALPCGSSADFFGNKILALSQNQASCLQRHHNIATVFSQRRFLLKIRQTNDAVLLINIVWTKF